MFVISTYELNDGETIYLFFDELQNLSAWEAQLKFLVDGRTAKTIVTGSSALRIGRGQDSLAGRLSIIELGPLGLREIAGIRGEATFDPFQNNGASDAWCSIDFWKDLQSHVTRNRRAILQAFGHFSDFAGYPITHKATGLDRTDYADQIVSIVIERTLLRDLKAGQFGASRDIRVVEEVLRRVCRYAGQAVRPETIQQQLDSVFQSGVSKNAVVDALRFLEDSLLLRRIPALEAAFRKQSNPDKLCLCDHFLREAALQERVPLSPADLQSCPESTLTIAGHIIESAIGYYLSDLTGIQVSWMPERSSEPEVDFVFTIGAKRIPIEVKYRQRAVREADLKGLRDFCSQQKYAAPLGLVVTIDEFA